MRCLREEGDCTEGARRGRLCIAKLRRARSPRERVPRGFGSGAADPVTLPTRVTPQAWPWRLWRRNHNTRRVQPAARGQVDLRTRWASPCGGPSQTGAHADSRPDRQGSKHQGLYQSLGLRAAGCEAKRSMERSPGGHQPLQPPRSPVSDSLTSPPEPMCMTDRTISTFFCLPWQAVAAIQAAFWRPVPLVVPGRQHSRHLAARHPDAAVHAHNLPICVVRGRPNRKGACALQFVCGGAPACDASSEGANMGAPSTGWCACHPPAATLHPALAGLHAAASSAPLITIQCGCIGCPHDHHMVPSAHLSRAAVQSSARWPRRLS